MKKAFLTMSLFAVAATTFVACNIEEEPKYLVQVSATEGGTVEGQNGEYKTGWKIAFKAIPSDGYYFSKWSDGNTDNPRLINVGTSDITITAEFVLPTIATVDLGLESGNLWTTCNVGAINPWDYGYYYSWGETEIKSNYSWETYKYRNSSKKITKYNNLEVSGTVDNKTVLDSTDDAATAVFGSDYSIPTDDDWKELGNQCYWVWTSNYNNRNVSGYIVYKAKTDGDKGEKVYTGGTPSLSYSLSDAHIFLPAAGRRASVVLYLDGEDGRYWSSSFGNNPYIVKECLFNDNDVHPSYAWDERYVGLSVRPVKRQ